MQITNITITNIKRYGTTDNSLDVTLKSNKYNLLVAPNGFGKSSLAKAFESLAPKGINLKKELYYQCNETLNPEIQITLDGQVYNADKSHNNITPNIEPFVINSGLYAKGSAQRFANVYNPQGRMRIEDVVVRRLIPEKSNFKYSYSSEKTNFGTHGKLMINMKDVFSNDKFYCDLPNVFDALDAYTTKSCTHRDNLYLNIKNTIQQLSGTSAEILANLPHNLFDAIEKEPNYAKIIGIFSDYGLSSHLSKYMAFYQIRHIYDTHKAELKKKCSRVAFEYEKSHIEKTIQYLESPAYPINLVEDSQHRELLVQFPEAENISNGQRDLMSLVANLIKFESIIESNKSYFLIIDEVFDYLDDANFIAAQYYLSSIMKEHHNVIITILTHLDPRYFRMSTVFNPKKLNVQFMMNTSVTQINPLRKLIVFRQGLNKEDNLYKDISNYQFHFSPHSHFFSGAEGYIDDLEELNSTDKIKSYVANELTKYFNKQTFDPIAVCLGIRYKSEKDMYELMPTGKRDEFLAQKGTRKRLKFADDILGEGNVDDMYYILSVLHNEINHLSDVNEEKVCIYQLENLTIKQMIHSLFKKDNIQTQDL